MGASLLDKVRLALRVTSKATDGEIRMWIDAAVADMRRLGIDPDFIDGDALAETAIVSFVKANYGYDVSEAARFDAVYRRIVCDLLNSPSYREGAGRSDG